jgi:hypothetical protein
MPTDTRRNNKTLLWTREKANGSIVQAYPGHWQWDFQWMSDKFLKGAQCLASVWQAHEAAGGSPMTADDIGKSCGIEAKPDGYNIEL